MGAGSRVVVVLMALAVGAGVLQRYAKGRERLPPRLLIADTLAEMPMPVAPSDVLLEPAADTVRTGPLALRRAFLSLDAGERSVLLTPVASRVRWRVDADEGAVLAFTVGVPRAEPPRPHGSAVRLRILVDGRVRWTRDIDPNRRRDRHWFDERVPLGAGGRSPVEIVLEAIPADPGRAAAGVPGWSHLRVVRESTRERQRASAAAPSVLVLLVDALRADALGCYGGAPERTPTIDRLAANGRLFAWAIAQAPWTAPAVASIFTGLHPRSHGVVGAWNDGGEASAGRGTGEVFLAERLPTLAEVAAQAGITTVGVSANPLVSRATNFAQGFETFAEFGWDDAQRNWAPAAAVLERFDRWLADNHDLRFFAYLHVMEPHDPYTPPAGSVPPPAFPVRRAVERGRAHELAATLAAPGTAPLSPSEIAYLRALYDAETHALDGAVAALLDTLARRGVRDSTVVALLGDHGEEFYEHGNLTHRRQLTDELLHVPFILAGPGIPSGRVDTQVQHIDVFPTLAAVLGLSVPPGLPGQSLLDGVAPRPAFVETEFARAADGNEIELVAVRAPPWKLMWAPSRARFTLFDLLHDPAERADGRAGGSEQAAPLAAALAAWHRDAPPPPPTTGRDPALPGKLRALGYAE